MRIAAPGGLVRISTETGRSAPAMMAAITKIAAAAAETQITVRLPPGLPPGAFSFLDETAFWTGSGGLTGGSGGSTGPSGGTMPGDPVRSSIVAPKSPGTGDPRSIAGFSVSAGGY